MFYIEKVNTKNKMEIQSWDKYHHSDYEPQYQEILRAVMADDIDDHIERVMGFQNNSDSDKVFSYVLKNNKGKIVAFTFFCLINNYNGEYDVFIQSIAVNPKYRGNGYAKQLLTNIFANYKKYIGVKPSTVCGLVCSWNVNSLRFFDKFSYFEKSRYGKNMYFIVSDFSSVYNNCLKDIDYELQL